MSKKLHSKLLSVVLVIAICCATLCGSIIGANAAMADYNGTYTITVGDDKNAVPFGANKVTATVTFELPAGFASGEFTIDTPTQFYSGVSDLKIVDGTVKPIYNGVEFSADNFEDCYLTDGVVSFADYDGYLYTSLTFEYTYNMVSFVTYGASYSYNGTSDYKGTRYPVSITVDGSTFGVDTDYVNASFSVSDTSDEHFHSHHAWYDSTSIANEKTTNGFVEQKDGKHYVSTAVCNYCQYFNSEYHYPQVYPDYTEFDTAVKMYNGAIGWMGISGVTVDYKDNGTLDVNVHVYSQHYSGNAFLLICDENGNELYRTGTVNNGTSNYKDNGFPTDEKCFTISDFSAQHIDTELLITVINLYNESNEMAVHHSRTMPFKLADYCTSVIGGVNGTELGNVVWGDASEEKKQADKNVAAALCYYSAAIDESVFEHVTANNGTLPGDTTGTDANKKTVKGADATGIILASNRTSNNAEEFENFVASLEKGGDGLKDSPYIITTSAQLYFILHYAGDNTAGKYFKVDESIGVFDMSNVYYGLRDNSAKFQGSFDGNGVTITNITASSYKAGLFPNVTGTAEIKNLKITNSSFTSTSEGQTNSGAIIADICGNFSNVTISNCVVTNCTVSALTGAGAIVGTSGNGNNLTIDNCFVSNNTVSSTNSNETEYKDNAVIGYGYHYNLGDTTSTRVINNSIVLGCDPTIRTTSTSNVYTADNVSIGDGAVSTMELNSAVWFDTESYPELHAFHELQTVSTGNSSGHTEKCVVKIDGTACTVKSPTVAPHDLTVEKEVEGVKYSTCSVCGWGKKVVGTTIVPNNKITVTWTGDKPESVALSGSGESAEDPCIITTPDELWYVTQLADDDKYYKIADNIGIFDFQDINWGLKDHTKYFRGHFDGNGVKLINFYSSTNMAALFPNVSGNAVIENIYITGADITTGDGQYASNAGCIIANMQGTANITVRNCAVVNSTVTAKQGAGAIIGSAGSQTLTVDSCFVANNTIDADIVNADTTEYKDNAVIGYGHTSTRTLTNTIAIGNDPNIRVSTAKNVYTDQEATVSGVTKLATDQMQGANALTNMTFDDMSAWFATDGYPELHAMHDMVIQYNNDDSHKLVCKDTLDSVPCTTCGVDTAHVDAGNSTCECGFVIEELIDTLALITEKFPDNADAIISILLGSDEEETLYETAFASNVLFKNAYSADNEEINGTIDDCCLYATSLNLKTTPHIAFTFAFQGVYRENKSNVTATFTCGDTVTTVTANEMINNEGAGRYHLYRFKDLPVVDLRKPISVEVKYDDNTLVKGTYSAAGYAINAMDLGTQYKWHAEAAKALVYYSEMLAARYGA